MVGKKSYLDYLTVTKDSSKGGGGGAVSDRDPGGNPGNCRD